MSGGLKTLFDVKKYADSRLLGQNTLVKSPVFDPSIKRPPCVSVGRSALTQVPVGRK